MEISTMHYLDNSATTQVCPEAAQAALSAMTEEFGNPSSTHTVGREAKKLLDRSRISVASALGCAPGELIFTSLGSESDNWALLSGAESMKRKGKHIISSIAEHDAIRRSLDLLEERGFEVTRLKPGKDGAVSVDAVRAALRKDTILVSLMLVNNETGAVTDIAGVSAALKAAGSSALLHTDAVQAFMKIPFSPKTLGADLISVSGHKIHAVAVLALRPRHRLPPSPPPVTSLHRSLRKMPRKCVLSGRRSFAGFRLIFLSCASSAAVLRTFSPSPYPAGAVKY